MPGATVRLVGVDTLKKAIKAEAERPDLIRDIVSGCGAKLMTIAKEVVPVRTGTLKRSITMELTDGGMTAIVGATAYYGIYVEMGTRFMLAEPYIKPAFDKVAPEFISDIERAVTKK